MISVLVQLSLPLFVWLLARSAEVEIGLAGHADPIAHRPSLAPSGAGTASGPAM